MSTSSSYSGLSVSFGSFRTSGLCPLVFFPMIQIMEKPLPSPFHTLKLPPFLPVTRDRNLEVNFNSFFSVNLHVSVS